MYVCMYGTAQMQLDPHDKPDFLMPGPTFCKYVPDKLALIMQAN